MRREGNLGVDHRFANGLNRFGVAAEIDLEITLNVGQRDGNEQVVEVVAKGAEANGVTLPALVEPDQPEVAAPMPATRPGRPIPQPIVEDPQKVYIREQIQTLGKSNPATVAQLIQTWMDEDRRN